MPRPEKTTLPSGLRVLRDAKGDCIVIDDGVRGQCQLYLSPDDVRELAAFANAQ